MTPTSELVFFGLPFLLCMGLTPLVRRLAFQRGWVSYPSPDRWHRNPAALFGGIAIFTSIVIPLLTIYSYTIAQYSDWPTDIFNNPLSFVTILLIGVGLLFVLGLIDDFLDIPVHLKLAGQIVVALVVVGSGYRLNWLPYLIPDSLVTVIWIVGIINAVNFIDNMDGLCAGVCMIAALNFALLFVHVAPGIGFIALVIAGACAGFLFYNFIPANIFMGDCGSMVLGFCVSFLSIYYSADISESTIPSIAVPALILAIPIFDILFVTSVRTITGRMIFVGGRDHTSHRLVLMGLSEKKTVLLLYGLSSLAGFSALQLIHFF